MARVFGRQFLTILSTTRTFSISTDPPVTVGPRPSTPPPTASVPAPTSTSPITASQSPQFSGPQFVGSGTLLTGRCATAQYTLIDYGPAASYVPFIGCIDSQPECCPFSPVTTADGASATSQRVYPRPRDAKDAIVKSCPADYYSTAGSCCPNAYVPWTAPLGGATPCYSTVVPANTTPAPAASNTIQPRATKPTVTVTDTVFAMQYAVLADGAPLSPGAIAGILIGAVAGVGALIGVGMCFQRWRRKRRGLDKLREELSSSYGANPGTSEVPTTQATALRDSSLPTTNSKRYGFVEGLRLNGNAQNQRAPLYGQLKDTARAARSERGADHVHPLEPMHPSPDEQAPSTSPRRVRDRGGPLPGESSNSNSNTNDAGIPTPPRAHNHRGPKPKLTVHGMVLPTTPRHPITRPRDFPNSPDPAGPSSSGAIPPTTTAHRPNNTHNNTNPTGNTQTPIFDAMSRHGRGPTWLTNGTRPHAPAPGPPPPDRFMHPPPRPAPAVAPAQQWRRQQALARQQGVLARPRAAYRFQGAKGVFGEPL